MGRKNKTVRERTVTDNKPELMGDLFDACCILESMMLLLRHYKNDSADEHENCWHGLSLILGGVLETVVDARETIEFCELEVKRKS